MDKMQFIPFITDVMNFPNLNWRISVGFDPVTFKSRLEWEELLRETDPNQHNWTPVPRTPEDCMEKWLGEIRAESGPAVRDFLWIREYRTRGELVFHFFVFDWGGDEDAYGRRWRNISGGWWKTYDPHDPRIIGLIGHLVMRKQCAMRIHVGIFDGLYTHENFIPWRPKERDAK